MTVGNEPKLRGSLSDGRMQGRRPARSGTILVVGVVLLVVGVLAGGILGHFSAPPVVAASTTEHLYLSIAFDPYSGLDKYFPANFTVPANVPVSITITNYDNGTNAVPADFAQVLGTVGRTETITDATASNVAVSSVPLNQVTHTFTLNAAPYDINVPIPAAHGTTPTVVTFTAVFTTAGQFEWHCMAPCDDAAMMTPGFMTGVVTVEGA
jgi:hypothetical protein